VGHRRGDRERRQRHGTGTGTGTGTGRSDTTNAEKPAFSAHWAVAVHPFAAGADTATRPKRKVSARFGARKLWLAGLVVFLLGSIGSGRPGASTA
jgi:hypothetical protein